ncbi:hypothetical protein Dsin_014596 [Dipteronia sinensis]|uniref:Oxidoreductase N-terminal domain-containing protein n=1 Tax=Dipteronia sinensis TaxID=43782 RepID=A0AAE0EA19_9ROSI|nr:hypothetical protein Dsin_014596 [Dipteronia sinensis]
MAGNNSEAAMMRNKQVILKKYINAPPPPPPPKESDLCLKTGSISLKVEQGTSAVIIKNLYLSCNLYSMIRMKEHNDHEGYSSDLPGSVLKGFGVGKVVESGHAELKKGDLVWGLTGWEEYSLITNPESLIKILHTDLPLSYYTGILGISGMTAWVGFYQICSPKKGEYVFISSAFGAVGQLYVEWSHNTIWIIRRAYTILVNILFKRIRMEGFVLLDYLSQYSKFLDVAMPSIREGKIDYVEDIVEGLENAAAALVGLSSGTNVGKVVIVVARD